MLLERFAAQVRDKPGGRGLGGRGRAPDLRRARPPGHRLAHRLRRLGVEAGVAVGLFAERSAEMVAGLLGDLEGGGRLPSARPRAPAGAPGLAAGGLAGGRWSPSAPDLRGSLPPHEAQVLLLDEADLDDATGEFDLPPGPGDPAYLIYTSGTTGKPKAVLVEHGGSPATLAAVQEVFSFGPGDRMPCIASFSFDIFLFELLGPLLGGGHLRAPAAAPDAGARARCSPSWARRPASTPCRP